MFVIPNIDLLIVVIAVAALVLAGLAVFFADPTKRLNQYFLLFSLVNAFWGSVNYLSYQVTDLNTALYLLRSILFFAVLQTMSFYVLMREFAKPKFFVSDKVHKITLGIGSVVALLALTPLFFTNISSTDGLAPNPEVSPFMVLFGLTTISFVVLGFIESIRKFLKSEGSERTRLEYVITGTVFMFLLIIAFNFLVPVLFQNTQLIPLGAIFVLPFAALTSYSILRYGLFNVRAVAIGVLTFLLVGVVFFEIIFVEDLVILLIKLGEAAFVLIFGALLFRSVSREVKQREKIEKLAEDLKVANDRLKELDRQKSEFVSIASHQLRSPITAIRGYISLILEKEFGDYPATFKEPLERISESSRLMVKSIEDYLNISRIEQGRMKYEMSEFDISDLTNTVVNEYKPIAEKKGLDITFSGAGKILVNADVGKIKQVIANLVDNSIKYTPAGSVTVKATAFENKARITVADTGIGLLKEDLEDLFNKFVRARGANKINTSGTGLGLYVAKQMVEAHKGKIWVESDGKGKGSRFIFELPTS